MVHMVIAAFLSFYQPSPVWLSLIPDIDRQLMLMMSLNLVNSIENNEYTNMVVPIKTNNNQNGTEMNNKLLNS